MASYIFRADVGMFVYVCVCLCVHPRGYNVYAFMYAVCAYATTYVCTMMAFLNLGKHCGSIKDQTIN